jgi:glycine/D-amino acid oxidase-like deaminating enzyme
MHIRPDGGGRIMMRHTDFDALVAIDTPVSPVPAVCDDLLARVRRVLPGLAGGAIEAVRIGIRPIPGDGHSVVGTVPGVSGLSLLATHSAVTLGSLLARLLSREIVSTERDERLQPFRPERFLRAAAD